MGDRTGVIDDRDTNVVSYSGNWLVGGDPQTWNGTLSYSNKEGDSLAVAFTGTQIEVYGLFDAASGGVQASYSVDGAQPVVVTSPSTIGDSYKQLFWRSGQFALKQHALNITMVKINHNYTAPEGTIWFDFFNVANAPPTATPSSSIVVPTASSSAPTSSNDAAAPSSSSNSLSGGEIAGIVIAVMAVLLALLAFFLWNRRHKARKVAHSESGSGSDFHSGRPDIQPFLTAPATPLTATPLSFTKEPLTPPVVAPPAYSPHPTMENSPSSSRTPTTAPATPTTSVTGLGSEKKTPVRLEYHK